MDLTELIPWLQAYDVLTNYEAESIKACVTSFKQNCCLLDLMMMKSDHQIQTFIQGLTECNQRHLATQIDPSGTIASLVIKATVYMVLIRTSLYAIKSNSSYTRRHFVQCIEGGHFLQFVQSDDQMDLSTWK